MKLISGIKRAIGELSALIFVPKCASCNQALPSKDIALCEKCEKAYLIESKKLCKKCGRSHRTCNCRIEFAKLKIPFVHVTGYDVRRSSVSKNIILSIKDDRLDGALDFLASDMLMALKERYIRLFERGNVIITYVPRSKKAKRRAGHDQSEQIAKRISQMSGAPLMCLFKNQSRSAQKKLDKAMRQKNAMENYSLVTPELRLENYVVIIIDDIVTTGSSIGACASLAKKNGAKATIGLVCAKTVSEKGMTELDKEKEYEGEI